MALADWELWACALAMERQHGDDAPRVIAAHIGGLALKNDTEGVATWQAIATRYDALARGAASPS